MIIKNRIIDIYINDYKINLPEFISLKIKESLFSVPVIELHLKQIDYKLIDKLNPKDKIKITFGASLDTLENYEFMITNFTYFYPKKNIELVISGILNIKEFSEKVEQKYYESTLLEIYKTFSIPLKTSIEKTNDKQIWIRYNISEFEFFKNTVKSSSIKLPLWSVNLLKELRLESGYADKESNIILTNSSKIENNEISVSLLNIETNNIDQFINNRKMIVYDIFTKEKIEYGEFERAFKPFINMHNVYDKYYENKYNNIIDYQKFSFNVFLSVNNYYEGEKKLGILDKVKLKLLNPFTGESILNDNFIITYKELNISDRLSYNIGCTKLLKD